MRMLQARSCCRGSANARLENDRPKGRSLRAPRAVSNAMEKYYAGSRPIRQARVPWRCRRGETQSGQWGWGMGCGRRAEWRAAVGGEVIHNNNSGRRYCLDCMSFRPRGEPQLVKIGWFEMRLRPRPWAWRTRFSLWAGEEATSVCQKNKPKQPEACNGNATREGATSVGHHQKQAKKLTLKREVPL